MLLEGSGRLEVGQELHLRFLLPGISDTIGPCAKEVRKEPPGSHGSSVCPAERSSQERFAAIHRGAVTRPEGDSSEVGIMNIGKRLQELRLAKGFSQGEIEHRTGMLRCYVSRVENGHTIPSLQTLEKMARALDLELHQLLHTGDTKLPTSKAPKRPPLTPDERTLSRVFGQLNKADQRLLLSMAHKMAATERRK